MTDRPPTLPLFPALEPEPPVREALGPGAWVLRGFAREHGPALLAAVAEVAAAAPFRRMRTPGGRLMHAELTACGPLGWVTDARGYRYVEHDPETGRPWPPLPGLVRELARAAAAEAGFPGFEPDACLVNRYAPGAGMSLHQDKNERDLAWPIVSFSLGLPATFLWGGVARAERPRPVPLSHGDVVVWGGPDRLRFHGVRPPADAEHPLAGRFRINLTLRRAR